jgi:VanZ family protein
MNNFFSKYKFFFYIFNFFIIFLYLFSGSLIGCYLYSNCKIQPQITSDFIISTNHFYAFFTLSVIGFFTYKKSNYFNFLIIYLLFLSVIIEMMHYFIPERSLEFSGLFGNLTGVLIVIIINSFLKKE